MINMIEDSSKLKKIDASEILQKIEKGEPVEYDHYIIEGYLDLSKLNLKSERNEMIEKTYREDLIDPEGLAELDDYYVYAQELKLVLSSIQITNSIIKNALIFKYGKFTKKVIFSNCIFNDRILFIGSNFHLLDFTNSVLDNSDFRFCCCFDEANFVSATFNGKANFKWSAFLGKLNFTKTTFNRTSNFIGAYFRDVDFSEANFKIADFSKAFFNHVSAFGHINLINKGAIFYGSANFESAKFYEDIRFHGVYFHDLANFKDARFKGYADFRNSIFKKNADFSNAEFFSIIDFSNSAFKDIVRFIGAKFYNSATFRFVKFWNGADFSNASFEGKTTFKGEYKFLEYIYFRFISLILPSETAKSFEQLLNIFDSRTIFDGSVYFDGSLFDEVDFSNTQFEKESTIYAAKFAKGFSFKETIFRHPLSEERSCRRAKKESESEGDKEEADRYYYREMAAKRRQKRTFIRYLECPFVQWIFGYGIYPKRLIISWIIIIISFGLIFYLVENGVTEGAEFCAKYFDYFKFSFSISIAPGTIASVLNSSVLNSGNTYYSRTFQATAMLEAIFGTFLWSCLIATFSRKYMR